MSKFFYLFMAGLILSSCQTYKTITPSIIGKPRQDFKLYKPIVIAIKDSRANVSNQEETIESLKKGLKSIYGEAIEFKPYFTKTDDNSIAIKINIKEIGSQFGSRVIYYQTIHNQINIASSAAVSSWGSAVATAITTQPIYQDNFIAQGWWMGAAHLEITLIGNLNDNKKIIEFPFVGEDKQSNTWGYKSGEIAAKNAWNKTSDHLLDLIDGVILRTIEYQ